MLFSARGRLVCRDVVVCALADVQLDPEVQARALVQCLDALAIDGVDVNLRFQPDRRRHGVRQPDQPGHVRDVMARVSESGRITVVDDILVNP